MSAPEMTKAQAEEAIEEMAGALRDREMHDIHPDYAATLLTLARAGAAVMFPGEEDVERVAEAMELCDTFSSEAFARAAIAAMKPEVKA